MFGKTNIILPSSDYVKDSLSFWLDAKLSPLTSSVWGDISPNNFSMTNRAGALSKAADGSVYFDGAGIRTTDTTTIFDGQAFTIECCVKINAINSGMNIIGWDGQERSFNGRGNIGLESSVIKFGNHTSSGWNNLYSSRNYIDGKYHTFTGVRNGTLSKFYIDGELVVSKSGGNYYQQPKYMQVGYYGSENSSTQKFNFYSVRQYTKELTAEEIAHNFAMDKERFAIQEEK